MNNQYEIVNVWVLRVVASYEYSTWGWEVNECVVSKK